MGSDSERPVSELIPCIRAGSIRYNKDPRDILDGRGAAAGVLGAAIES